MNARGLLLTALVISGSAVCASAEAGSSSADAAAQKKACIHAAEAAQAQRLEGHLVEAKAALETCAADRCPAVVRDDCRTWLADVSASVPTVVFQAAPSLGAQPLEVRVDGAVLPDALDGREFPMNPGEHHVDVVRADGKRAEQVVVLRVSEKRWVIDLAPLDEQPKAVAVVPPPARGGLRVTPLAWTFFGVGAASLAASLVIGIGAKSDANTLERECKPACDPAKVDDVRARVVISDVTFGVGLAAVGVATVLVLTSERAPPVTAGFLPGGFAASYGGTF